MVMDSFIKQSLLNSFMDSPLLYDLLTQVDYSEIEYKYSEILISQFTNEEYTLLNMILNSGVYQKYIQSHNLAMSACSAEIAEIIDLVSNFEGCEH